jgi:hypothetical protein
VAAPQATGLVGGPDRYAVAAERRQGGQLSRVLARSVAWLALVLTAGLLAPTTPAQAAGTPLQVVGHGATTGTPVPGGFLTADLGTWTSPPSSYSFEWLRDGVPIPGAASQDYDVQAVDVGHQVAPRVTGSDGMTQATFTGDAVGIRKIGSSLTLDVRRVHPPGKSKLVWAALTFLSTERPWPTEGGTVTAFKQKGDRLRGLARATFVRGAAFVRLPWKNRAPQGTSRVVVCYSGNEAVEASCSPFDVVRNP